MIVRPGRVSRKNVRGFSLVELLLTVALIVLLMGAVVFNFSSAQQGAELDEGAAHIESLIRFAKAHAASSGRRVRLTFEEDVGDGLMVPIGNLDVTWEPDPLQWPDHFVPLPETAGYVRTILDLVMIENVRPPATTLPPIDSLGLTNGMDSVADEDRGFGFPPITFYPDGSSDSAEITIASRNGEGEDRRRIAIQLVGLTGAIRRRAWTEAEPGLSEQPPTVAEPDSATGAPAP